VILAPLKELLQEMLANVDKAFRTNPLTLLFCISILTDKSSQGSTSAVVSKSHQAKNQCAPHVLRLKLGSCLVTTPVDFGAGG